MTNEDVRTSENEVAVTGRDKRVVELCGEEYEFESFSDYISLVVNKLIFDGKTYPVIDFVDDVRVILDVGANVGAASLFFSAHYPGALIYSFEPSAPTVELLRRNTQQRENVTCFPFGLYEHPAEAVLQSGDEGPGTATVGGDAAQSSGAEHITLRSTADWLQEHRIDRVDILKVDTEGCEVPILRGMQPLIPSVKVIYLEYHSEDDRRILDEMVSASHVLVFANAYRLHRGELTYVAKAAFSSPEALAAGAIRVDL